jgi:hypothetical protein
LIISPKFVPLFFVAKEASKVQQSFVETWHRPLPLLERDMIKARTPADIWAV